MNILEHKEADNVKNMFNKMYETSMRDNDMTIRVSGVARYTNFIS